MSSRCHKCNGVGEDLSAGPSINAMDYLPCDVCKGTGQQPEPTKEELLETRIDDLEELLRLAEMFAQYGSRYDTLRGQVVEGEELSLRIRKALEEK